MCGSYVIIVLLAASSAIAVGFDTNFTNSSRTNSNLQDSVLVRSKREANKCSKEKWQCRDGSCIAFDGKCDGVVNCADGSDETHALCRHSQCQKNWFRCTYGACVDGTAPCNGRQECADKSDELLPRCRNETEKISGQFKCADGSYISGYKYCDGSRDCADGSDETLATCAANTCLPYHFQCAYGACVDGGSHCNKIFDCADYSDEVFELCGDQGIVIPNTSTPTPNAPTPSPINTTSTTTTNTTAARPADTSKYCELPPYPEHGTYTTTIPNAKPGDLHKVVDLTVTCNRGYGVEKENSTYCINGNWKSGLPIPKCHRMCTLKPHESVIYKCRGPKESGERECNGFEHNGTRVTSKCDEPNYFTHDSLAVITCIDGYWSDSPPKCKPECGSLIADGIPMIIHGQRAKRGEVPWHAGIYEKIQKEPFYKQICGGTLISRDVVLSAAHCFWDNANNMQKPSSNYMVAVGKLYRAYQYEPENKAEKEHPQTSEVKAIYIPPQYYGAENHHQSDIAVVVTMIQFTYRSHVRPACINIDDRKFNDLQLTDGSFGKVAGWGLVEDNGGSAPMLQVTELPTIPYGKCREAAPEVFVAYLTADKICAGYLNGTSALCEGDSGGGLLFPTKDRTVQRYYLRGIVSTAPTNDNLCNSNTFSTFTEIIKHDYFIKEHWQGK